MSTPSNAPNRRQLLGLAAALAALPLAARAYDENATAEINVDPSGLALRGHDPVAYHTMGKPTLGDARFEATYEGARYRFASAEHRDAFVKEPARYAPAYGGFCAMGVSLEKKFDGDPQLWRIVDGKLYVNVAPGAHTRWLEDVKGNIGRAEGNWPKIKDKAPKAL